MLNLHMAKVIKKNNVNFNAGKQVILSSQVNPYFTKVTSPALSLPSPPLLFCLLFPSILLFLIFLSVNKKQ